MKKKYFFIVLPSLILVILALLFVLLACESEKRSPENETNTQDESPPSDETNEEEPSEESNPTASEASFAPEDEPTQTEMIEEIKTFPIIDPTVDYTVSLFDYTESPITEKLTVKLIKNGQVVANGQTQNGVAAFSLPPDNYTVEVDLEENSAFFYDSEDPILLSRYVSSVSIILYNRPSRVSETVYAYSIKQNQFCNFEAEIIGEGRHTVEAAPIERTYFLFTPEKDGRYEIVLDTDNSLLLGYFGDANYALQNSIAENLENNTFVLNVKPGNIGLPYLLGITSAETVPVSCSLSITRIGDAILNIGDLPFEQIEAKNLPDVSFHSQISPSSSVTDLEITDRNLTVALNETDGFYHLGNQNGPLVYMRIGTPSAYLDALATVATQTGLSRYFYDENGRFTHKEQYNRLFLAYADVADPLFGLVPLTEELASAIQNAGEGMEWWKFASPNYLFGMTAVDPTTAWLFACCTVASE